MNPIRQRLIANGNIAPPKKQDIKVVKAHPDAIRNRDTNQCKIRKALAILEKAA